MTGDKQGPAAASGRRSVVVFAGPTASGKSAAALAAAREFGGVVINADSMQVYRELAILTARPDAQAMEAAPHRLYGVISARESFSVARWREMALAEIDAALTQGKLPILAGGTGMYIDALLKGLAPVPPIPDAILERGRALLREEGNVRFHARLAKLDPTGAAKIRSFDRQRLFRAWTVVKATGKPLSEWQRATVADAAIDALIFVFLPTRADLYAACDRRFEAMIAAGAIEEVRALLALGLSPDLPAMKAVGVREIGAYLGGEIDRARMIELGQQSTRRYAKRQYTWFRTRPAEAHRTFGQYSEISYPALFNKIRDSVLTL